MGVKNISVNNGELVAETGVIEYEGFGHLPITDEKIPKPQTPPVLLFHTTSETLPDLTAWLQITFDGYEAEGLCTYINAEQAENGYIIAVQIDIKSIFMSSDICSALVK